jgi:hypothetical protein
MKENLIIAAKVVSTLVVTFCTLWTLHHFAPTVRSSIDDDGPDSCTFDTDIVHMACTDSDCFVCQPMQLKQGKRMVCQWIDHSECSR